MEGTYIVARVRSDVHEVGSTRIMSLAMRRFVFYREGFFLCVCEVFVG